MKNQENCDGLVQDCRNSSASVMELLQLHKAIDFTFVSHIWTCYKQKLYLPALEKPLI